MAKSKKPLISVLTATWDREKFIIKLAKSLKKQSFKNFEWIVANDGSLDNTDKIIRSFAKTSRFKIVYINSSLRVGKSKLDNLMLKNMSGKYVTQCGSDDILLPKALENLYNLTKKIPNKEKNKYIGIFANGIDTNGISQTFPKNNMPSSDKHISFEELKKIIKGDGVILEKSKFLKGKKFLEVDFLITESSLFEKIYKNKKFILSPKIMKIMDRSAENNISFGKKMRYTRGSAYCIAEVLNKKNFTDMSFFNKIITITNYWRYTIHGDINFQKGKKMLKPLKDYKFLTLLFPLAYLITLRDIFLNKVEKTHIEFNKNIKKSKISVENLN